jgi:hypothetical protein
MGVTKIIAPRLKGCKEAKKKEFDFLFVSLRPLSLGARR